MSMGMSNDDRETYEKAKGIFDRITRRLQRPDYSEVLQGPVGEILRDQVRSNFAQTQNADGEAWQPHGWRAIHFMGVHPLLIWTGALLDAATGQGAGHVREVQGGSELQYGVSSDVIPYARFQHEGGEGIFPYDGQPITVPSRKYMTVSGKTADDIAEAIADSIVEGIMREATA